MFTTTIDIQIRTLDSTGSPTSVSDLEGIVRNFEGAHVDTLTFDDLVETSAGVYAAQGYDVSDASKFPGTELTVFWCVEDAGVSPETAYQYYEIFSPLATSGSTRLLTWCPVTDPEVYGYQIFRKLETDTEAQEYGRSVFPYFFDRGTYNDQREFELATFSAQPLRWGTDGTVPTADGNSRDVTLVVNDKQYCEIFGEVLDALGDGSAESIYFYVHESDAPQASGRSLFMRRNEIAVTPNTRGQFSIPLVQSALITAEIPAAGIIRRFIVPSKPRVNFKDLDFYPLETHRAQ
jgi:hypothetical protein